MISVIVGFQRSFIKQGVAKGAWAIKRSSHNLIVADTLGRIVFSALIS
jgi:predicted transcriptional regulator